MVIEDYEKILGKPRVPPSSGRTFPNNQYFSTQLGPGQLSLYNLLKAYSLLDTEVGSTPAVCMQHRQMMVVIKGIGSCFCGTQVGYCQGVSFVAGVLLLHMSEEQAFDTLKFLMYDLGIRRQYKPDMVSLQVSA